MGLRRLFMLALKEQVKYLEKNLPGLQAMAMQFLPFGSQQDLQRQILAVTFDRCCLNRAVAGKREGIRRALQGCEGAPESCGAGDRAPGRRCTRRTSGIAEILVRIQGACSGAAGYSQPVRWLLGKEWVAGTPYERMQHLPRYLKAINVRLEKLRSNPARDAQNMAQMNPLLQQWQRRLSAQHGEPDARLEDFGWMLQELRVSLYAQELKTPVIVSVKRLEKMLAEMSR